MWQRSEAIFRPMRHSVALVVGWAGRHVWWLAAVMLAFCLGSVLGWLRLGDGVIVWGTAGEWSSGLVTAGALLLAVRGFLVEQHMRTQAQARLVNAWLDDSLALVVRNASDEPAYGFSVAWFDPVAHERAGTPETVFSVHCFPPGSAQSPEIELGGTHRTDGRLPARMGIVPHLTVEFVDAGGHLWRRSGGRLSQVRSRVTYEERVGIGPELFPPIPH
jgi:hypothetical protein